MRVVFIGSAELSGKILKMLVESDTVQVVGAVTQPDKPAGRQKKLTPCRCKEFVNEQGIPCLTPVRINAPESLVQIAAWLPDVIVVIAYGQFLCKQLLEIPPLGCINIHLSLLPRYRGASPIQASILNGDIETGVCAMIMETGMDSGPVLMQSKTRILAHDTCVTLHDRLAIIGGNLLIDVLPKWERHEIIPIPQDQSAATFAYKIAKSDGVLYWSDPTEISMRKIRAFAAWPSCYTMMPSNSDYKGKILKIIDADSVLPEQSDLSTSPGTILQINKKGIYVKTIDGVLALRTVHVEGGKPSSASALFNGNSLSLKEGDLFVTPLITKSGFKAKH